MSTCPKPPLLAVLTALLCSPTSSAQSPAELARSVEVEVVAALHEQADALAAEKQYGRALQLRRDIVQEWAPGDGRALLGLGFVRVGDTYKRDMAKVVFERDVGGDKKQIKKLERAWDRTHKQLVRSVEGVAKAFDAAGDATNGTRWWRRVLSLQPGHRKALQSMQLLGFDGHDGTPRELRLLRRGRAIAQAVDYLKRAQIAVEPLSEPNPVLDKAGIRHHGFRTTHFRFWGTLGAEDLQEAARYAERSLLLAHTLFGSETGQPFVPRMLRDVLWVTDRASYHKVLDACRDQFDQGRLDFLKNDVELAFVASGADVLRLYVVDEGGQDVVLDQTVRGVMQDATKFASHGLWEGIGHAVCGLLFNRTLTFFIEQQTGQTVTSYTPRPLVPDMNVWREIAAESAWGNSDTPTSRLVLLHGAKFTNEERVKAWAMADFLLRDRPELLFELDASPGTDKSDPPSVEAEFRRRTGLELPALDAEWRRYWGQEQALRDAMAAAPKGEEKVVAAARTVADAINDARAAADRGPIGFYVATDAGSKAVHEYYAALERAEKELAKARQKDPEATVPMPSPPAALGRSVLGFRGDDAAAAVADWLCDPALRDELLHPGRLLIGCSPGRTALVVELSEPSTATVAGPPVTWPRDGQTIAGEVIAHQVGPALADALAAAGRGPADRVGAPLTLHFGRELERGLLAAIACEVTGGGRRLAGVLVDAQDQGSPGCVVFVPLQPLPSGEVTVQWQLPRQVLEKGQVFAPARFRVR